jgi:hypothetical protein
MSDAGTTTYHISPLRLWLAPAIFVGVAVLAPVVLIFDKNIPEPKTAAIWAGLGFLVFGVGMYLILRHTRLVLTTRGVKLIQFGYTLETGWENVAQLDESPDNEGLVLKLPMECNGSYRFSRFRYSGYGDTPLFTREQLQLIAKRRLIPLNVFAYRLTNDDLRNDLLRRAPALKES